MNVRTQTQTFVTREGDKITIKEVVTTTTTKSGEKPDVKVVERVNEYDVNDMPEDLRAELGEIAAKDKTSKKKLPDQSSGTPQAVAKEDIPPPTQIDAKELAKLNEDCVICHNAYRKKHGVDPLKYNKELAAFAQNWAEYLAKSGKLEHRKQDKYGENLYMFYSSNPSVLAPASAACESWYSEIKGFVFGKEPKSLGSGHFTQMIWKSTKEVGMGRARAASGKQIVVANYHPPGNFIGSFSANVPKPL